MPGRRFRIYSREFKESAVRRVLGGEKIRAVARELRLGNFWTHGWTITSKEARRRSCPGAVRGRPRRGRDAEPCCSQRVGKRACTATVRPVSRSASRGWRNWSARSASRRWSSIFSKQPCGASRHHVSRAPGVAAKRLRGHPRDDASARRAVDRADVRAGWGEPGQLLPALAPGRPPRGTDGSAGCPPTVGR